MATSYPEMAQTVEEILLLLSKLKDDQDADVGTILEDCIKQTGPLQFQYSDNLSVQFKNMCNTLFAQCGPVLLEHYHTRHGHHQEGEKKKKGESDKDKKKVSLIDHVNSYTLFVRLLATRVEEIEDPKYVGLIVLLESDLLTRKALLWRSTKKCELVERNVELAPNVLNDLFLPMVNSAMLQFGRIIGSAPDISKACAGIGSALGELDELDKELDEQDPLAGRLAVLQLQLKDWRYFLFCVPACNRLAADGACSDSVSIDEADNVGGEKRDRSGSTGWRAIGNFFKLDELSARLQRSRVQPSD